MTSANAEPSRAAASAVLQGVALEVPALSTVALLALALLLAGAALSVLRR